MDEMMDEKTDRIPHGSKRVWLWPVKILVTAIAF